MYATEEREAFLARPQVSALTMTPQHVLVDAGMEAARRGSLPLERWLHAVRTVRPERPERSERPERPERPVLAGAA